LHTIDFDRVRLAVSVIAALHLLGCSTAPTHTQGIDPQFHGIWTNVNPDFFNWWEITSTLVVGYGIALENGKCSSNQAQILSENRIDVSFGNAAIVEMRILDEQLLFVADPATAYHKRVPREDICRKSDGTYFEGAPYAQ
jgi:hypothetical protein